MKNQKGFSLIELLIVVVIIGIIAAIAIPNLLAARRSANEGSAVSSLRTVHGSNATYQATTGNGHYAPFSTNNATGTGDWTTAGPALNTAGLIDSVLSAGSKSGFNFTYVSYPFLAGTAGNPSTFALMGQPQITSGITATGTRAFGIATDGVVYAEVIDSTSGTVTMAFAGDAATGAVINHATNTNLTPMGGL